MIIYIYIGISVFSLLIATLFVPFNLKFSQKIGSIDYPTKRSIHSKKIPKSGGLTILMGIYLTLIILILMNQLRFNNLVIGFALGALLIFMVGFFDDIFDLKAWHKVILEIIIILIIAQFGFNIRLLTNPFNQAINLGLFSLPLTVIWFLIIMNSINLIDGLDGLATGIVAISGLVLGIAGIICNNIFVSYIAFAVFGSCLGFLRYNFYPAQIFLGDAGSLLLGFVIAALSVAGNTQFKGATTMTLLIPIIVLSVPLLDTVITILRRLKSPDNIFQADKNHLHHKMLNLGLSHKTVVLFGYFLTFLFGLISMGFLLLHRKVLFSLLVIIGLICLIIFISIVKKEFLKWKK